MLEISILDVWCLTHHQASNSSKTSPKKIPPSYAARHVEARISGILRINAMVGITVKDHADHQPFQSLRWLDFCHVAVNSQVCSLGTKVYQCWFGSVFVSAVSTWLVFVFQMLGIPPSTQKKNSTLPHCNKAPAPPFPPRLPSIIRSEGRCFSSRKLGLWSRVKATPSHALPFFVPSTAVLSWVKTVALEVSACQKKKRKGLPNPLCSDCWKKEMDGGRVECMASYLTPKAIFEYACYYTRYVLKLCLRITNPSSPSPNSGWWFLWKKNTRRLGLGLLSPTTQHNLVESYWRCFWSAHHFTWFFFNLTNSPEKPANSGGNSRHKTLHPKTSPNQNARYLPHEPP